MTEYQGGKLFSFLFFSKTGALCKLLAQKLPGQLQERLKGILAKKIALGRYFCESMFFISVLYCINFLSS